jgi:hypothetical protein
LLIDGFFSKPARLWQWESKETTRKTQDLKM